MIENFSVDLNAILTWITIGGVVYWFWSSRKSRDRDRESQVREETTWKVTTNNRLTYIEEARKESTEQYEKLVDSTDDSLRRIHGKIDGKMDKSPCP